MFHKQYDDVYSSATGMQYSLYATVLICAAGGGFFLWSTLTVEKDKEVKRMIIDCLSVIFVYLRH